MRPKLSTSILLARSLGLYYPAEMSLPENLRKQISQTEQRIAELRAAVSQEEVALKVWRNALALADPSSAEALRQRSSVDGLAAQTLTPAEARDRSLIVLKLLGQSKDGLNSRQIVEAVSPVIARSSLFAMLRRLVHGGRVVQDGSGVYRLAEVSK
jgi:hypothetical protein